MKPVLAFVLFSLFISYEARATTFCDSLSSALSAYNTTYGSSATLDNLEASLDSAFGPVHYDSIGGVYLTNDPTYWYGRINGCGLTCPQVISCTNVNAILANFTSTCPQYSVHAPTFAWTGYLNFNDAGQGVMYSTQDWQMLLGCCGTSLPTQDTINTFCDSLSIAINIFNQQYGSGTNLWTLMNMLNAYMGFQHYDSSLGYTIYNTDMYWATKIKACGLDFPGIVDCAKVRSLMDSFKIHFPQYDTAAPTAVWVDYLNEHAAGADATGDVWTYQPADWLAIFVACGDTAPAPVALSSYCDTLQTIISNIPDMGTSNVNLNFITDAMNNNISYVHYDSSTSQLVTNTLSYWLSELRSCGDSCPQILSCDSVNAAIAELSGYNVGGGNGLYSLPFAEAYLGVRFPQKNFDAPAWGFFLSCCQPATVILSDMSMSHCEKLEYLRLLMHYNLPDHPCLPAWVYNYMINQLVPMLPGLSDTSVTELCTDLTGCKLTCPEPCDEVILTSCDSINSVNYVYKNLLAFEGATIDTTLLDNAYTTMYGQVLPYNAIRNLVTNCNNDTAVLTEITYSAQNVNYSSSGGQYYVDFDVFATDTPNNLLFSQGNIFVQYDTTIFGSSIVGRGAITATKGQAVDSPYYNMALTDSTPNMLKISITHTPNPASLANLDNASQQLCHLRVNLTGFNLTSVAAAFDTIAMAGHSMYQQTPAGLEFPYDIIRINGLAAAAQQDEDSINFSIVGLALDDPINPSYVLFDVLATANIFGANLARCSVTINFDPRAFDSAQVVNIIGPGDDASFSLSGTGCCGGNEIYSFSTSFTPGSLNISLDADSNYDPTPSSLQTFDKIYASTTFAHVRLYIANCHYFPKISIDPSSFAEWNDTNNITQFTRYNPVHIGPGYNDSICTPLPQVTGWTPTCTNAGSFEVMTIAGHYFGSDYGMVYFNNANNPGTFIHAHDDDILNWTPDTITLLIPSALSTNPALGTAGSGVFYVETHGGLNNAADSVEISISHANYNIRSSNNLAHFAYLRDSTYVFQLSSNLFLTSGVLQSVQSVFRDLRCQTGINFWVDSNGASPVDTANGSDHINVISMQPDTAHVFDHIPLRALAVTSPYTHSCSNSLHEYNNSASYGTDMDITFKNPPPSQPGYSGSYGWNWWLYVTSLTSGNYDAVSVLTHELGHAAMLGHALPEKSGSLNVMSPYLTVQQVRRNYDDDENSILGIKYCLSLGNVLGASGGCPSATPVYPSGCPTVNPVNCAGGWLAAVNEVNQKDGNFSCYLYPNPYTNNTIVHVDVSEFDKYSINIYDIVGHVISSQNISASTSFDLPLTGFDFSSGIYLIQVSSSRSSATLKLIKL